MSNTTANKNSDWIKILNVVALILCVFCLASIAVSLQPVAKWANNQNICIEQEMSKSNAPVSWGVRKCNGRSKVYKVMEKSIS